MAKTVILYPLSIILGTNWGTSVASVTPGKPLSHDDDTDYLDIDEPNSNELQVDLTNKPNDILQVSTVTPLARVRSTLGAPDLRVGVQLFGSSTYTSANQIIGTYSNEGASVSRPGGGPWLPSDIADPSLYVIVDPTFWDQSPDTIRCTSIWLSLTYEPVPAADDAARDSATRIQTARTFYPPLVRRELLNPADAFKVGLLGKLRMSHRDGPEPAGLGWRSAVDKTRAGWLQERALDLNTGQCEITLKMIRPQLFLLRYTARAKSPAPIADGVGFMSEGARLEMTRDSIQYVADQSGSGNLVRVEKDQPKYCYAMQPASGTREHGLLLEPAAENEVPESSFRNQLTGWGSAGGGTITAETSPLLFNQNESGYVAKMKAATPHVTDLTLTSASPTATITANTKVCVQVYYQTGAGATSGPGVSIQRGVDSKWLDFSDGSWNVAKVVNATPVSNGEWVEFYATAMDVGGTGTTLTPVLTIESGEPDSSEYYIGHVQIVSSVPYPVSPISRESAAATTSADAMLVTNDSGARCVTVDEGAIAFEFVPSWDAADLAADQDILILDHDANNRITFRWSNTNTRWELVYKAGGTEYIAFLASPTPTRGVATTLVGRWKDPPLFSGASFAAHYKLEADGTDEFGAADLTEVNSPTYAVAVDGNGAQLTLVTNKSDSPYFTRDVSGGEYDPGGSSFVVALWFRLDGGDGRSQVIFDCRNATLTQGFHLFRNGSGNTLRFHLEDDSGNITQVDTTETVVVGDGFVDVVVVVDRGTDTIDLYLSGILVASASMTGTPDNITNLQTLFVGADFNATTFNVDGRVDEVIYVVGRTWDAEDVARYHANDYEVDALDIFAAGTKGTSVPKLTLTETSPSDLEPQACGGVIREIHSYSYAPTDEECGRYPRT